MAEKIINSEQSLEAFVEYIRSEFKKKKYLRVKVAYGRQRTLTQNAALHKYFQMVADELNAAGLDMRKVLKEEVEISWTKDTVKDNLWRPIQMAITGKESTTMPLTDEYSKVYEVLSRHLASKLGIYVPFPSREGVEHGD